jgi:hypothetical protein
MLRTVCDTKNLKSLHQSMTVMSNSDVMTLKGENIRAAMVHTLKALKRKLRMIKY